MHKKTFSLESGQGLNDPQYAVRTFPVELRDGELWLLLPPADVLRAAGPCPPAARGAAPGGTAPAGDDAAATSGAVPSTGVVPA
jgi:hypothetical protein